MIKFLGRIRQNIEAKKRTANYLKYAIGEILLVVIGILIALQVNNWNESRKLSLKQQKIFTQILTDLKTDSISIEKTMKFFKDGQDLYYRLYDEMKGISSYDSIVKYGFIRYAPSFNSVVINDKSMVDNIINEKVRHELIAYFRTEERVQNLGVGQFMDLQVNFVRPYLTASGIGDVDATFSIPRYEDNDPDKMISYEVIKSQFNTPEFAQVLYELRLKSASSIQSLRNLKEANYELQKTIREAMSN